MQGGDHLSKAYTLPNGPQDGFRRPPPGVVQRPRARRFFPFVVLLNFIHRWRNLAHARFVDLDELLLLPEHAST